MKIEKTGSETELPARGWVRGQNRDARRRASAADNSYCSSFCPPLPEDFLRMAAGHVRIRRRVRLPGDCGSHCAEGAARARGGSRRGASNFRPEREILLKKGGRVW